MKSWLIVSSLSVVPALLSLGCSSSSGSSTNPGGDAGDGHETQGSSSTGGTHLTAHGSSSAKSSTAGSGAKSSTAATGSTTESGDGGASSTGGSGSTTSSTAGGSSSTASSSAASLPYNGSINLLELSTEVALFSGSAGFYMTPTTGLSDCPGTKSGPYCCYLPHGTTSSSTAVSAGTITLTDGSQIGQFTFGATSYPMLSNQTTTTLHWKAGDTIMVSAAGDTVDAFSGSAVAPQAIAGLTPTLSETIALTVTRANGLPITWTAGSGSDSYVYVAIEDVNVDVITCQVPLSAGMITIPSAILNNFATGSGSVGVHALTDSVITDTNASVFLLVNGAPVNGKAMFQ